MHILQPLREQLHFSHINDLREQAHTYLLRDDPAAALSACTAALARLGDHDPARAEFYVCRGRAQYRLAQYDAAIGDFDRALALDPRLAEAYANRGLAYHSLGQLADALGDLNVAAYLNPRFQAARAAVIDEPITGHPAYTPA